MTKIDRLPDALKPAVEAAAKELYETMEDSGYDENDSSTDWRSPSYKQTVWDTWVADAERQILAFLNAAIEGGEAQNAYILCGSHGWFTPYHLDKSLNNVSAIIIRMENSDE